MSVTIHRQTGRTEEDEQLISTVREQHGNALLGLVLRLTNHDRQWAEDVVQETFLGAWRNPQALTGHPAQVRAWLWTVARRIVIDNVRARNARPREVEPEPLAGIAVADGLDDTLTAVLLADALKDLSASHREALVQTYLRDRPITQVAADLGIPLGTVKSRVYYALRALRSALEVRGVLH